jgi:hypothetical protein
MWWLRASPKLPGMPTGPSSSPPADVIILGGGVAALEAMMALRELVGDRVRVSLVAASEDFVERPMSVAEPFGLGTVRRYPLCEIAADFGARFVHAAAIGVDAREPRLVFADGATLAGSTLIPAPGRWPRSQRRSQLDSRTPAGPCASSWRPRARRGPARRVRGAEPRWLDAV